MFYKSSSVWNTICLDYVPWRNRIHLWLESKSSVYSDGIIQLTIIIGAARQEDDDGKEK